MHLIPHSFSWYQHLAFFIFGFGFIVKNTIWPKKLREKKLQWKIAYILFVYCWTKIKLNVEIELHSHLLFIAMAIIHFRLQFGFLFVWREQQKNNYKRLLYLYSSTQHTLWVPHNIPISFIILEIPKN